ncbi:glycosyltransferase family 39 protein [Streptomyces bicolor]|uniref:glycosyltransferase family 39 protein n=1 Tax=Streptomyces bicolor TaxID=66874 RepID=UPI000AAE2F98|nr:glycosyltransferase family 39 protein [Streptomyces bicolor]
MPKPRADDGSRFRLPAAALAIGLFLAARIAGSAAVAVAGWAVGKQPLTLLGHSWDSSWYLGIATHGYGATYHRPGHVLSDLAFFPLYPSLIRAVTEVTPLSAETAGLVVSWLAAAVAAWGIYAIGARLHGRAVATALVVLWGLLPQSVVLSMAYTEPVFIALAAWSLYAVLARHWVWAGTWAALAGLSRPNGFAVAAAVLAAAAVEIWRSRGRVSPRLWAGAALAPLGWTGYVLWVGQHKGDLLGGYFEVQRGWGNRFDFGIGTLRFAYHLLVVRDVFQSLAFHGAFLITAVAVLLYALLIIKRAPLPLVVYSGVLVVVALGGSAIFEARPRLLLPAFPLLLPVAQALVRAARARPWRATVVIGALAGLSFAYGAYLVVFADTPP